MAAPGLGQAREAGVGRGPGFGTPISPGMMVSWYLIVREYVERTTTLITDTFETVTFICRTQDNCGRTNSYTYTADFTDHWEYTNPPKHFWRWNKEFLGRAPWNWPKP